MICLPHIVEKLDRGVGIAEGETVSHSDTELSLKEIF